MKKIKDIALKLPEYLLILSILFYWGSTAVVFNPVAITLMTILILQIVFKNKSLGLIIPSLLIALSLLMLLALASELSEFPSYTPEAEKLLIVGLSYFTATIIVSGLMFYKYATLDAKREQILFSKN